MILTDKPEVPANFEKQWPGWTIKDGMPWRRMRTTNSLSRGVWIQCDHCGRIAPQDHYNRGKYCSSACAYAERKGGNHPRWTGGRSVDKRGYVRIQLPDGRRVQEHRYVMEQKLGRPLLSNEHVHHINGEPSDNHPDNLEVWIVGAHRPKTHPAGVRASDYHCPGCRCFEH